MRLPRLRAEGMDPLIPTRKVVSSHCTGEDHTPGPPDSLGWYVRSAWLPAFLEDSLTHISRLQISAHECLECGYGDESLKPGHRFAYMTDCKHFLFFHYWPGSVSKSWVERGCQSSKGNEECWNNLEPLVPSGTASPGKVL